MNARRIAIFTLLLAACDGESRPEVAGSTDVDATDGSDSGIGLESPVLASWTCPLGWEPFGLVDPDGRAARWLDDESAGATGCRPPTDAEPCGDGERRDWAAGNCVRIGTDCPSDAERWPSEDAIWNLVGEAFRGNVLYVDSQARDSDRVGSREQPYLSFREAMDSARGGDVIALAPGEYPRLRVTKDEVAVVGACPQQTLLVDEQSAVFVDSVSGVFLGNLGVERGSVLVADNAGVTIAEVIALDLIEPGVFAARGAQVVVRSIRFDQLVDEVVDGMEMQQDAFLVYDGASLRVEDAVLVSSEGELVLSSGADATFERVEILTDGDTMRLGTVSDGSSIRFSSLSMSGSVFPLNVDDSSVEMDGVWADTSRCAAAEGSHPCGNLSLSNGAVGDVSNFAFDPGESASAVFVDGRSSLRLAGGYVGVMGSDAASTRSPFGAVAVTGESAVEIDQLVVSIRDDVASRRSGGSSSLRRTNSVISVDEGGTASIRDLVVEGTIGDGGTFSTGLFAAASGHAEVEGSRWLFASLDGTAVSLNSGTSLVASHTVIDQGRVDERGLGAGLLVYPASNVRLDGLAIVDAKFVGLGISGPDTDVVVRNLEVVGTRLQQVLAGWLVAPDDVGTGVFAAEQANLDLEQFSVVDSATVGLQVINGASITARDGDLSRNAIGLNLYEPAESVSFESSFARVRITDNLIDIETTRQPAPDIDWNAFTDP